ncbi:hypothetical protein CBOM_04078 [Ceraceosorus bombacis]|uniref:Uncharacterized protein n=1 Tax=Ceraceosorus bombacis TaxID=401625 RepID=A0A0P1BLZ7_9BASI|nr:hypothetical protein CBOM_04078 [Ceraceosorus bombacis]
MSVLATQQRGPCHRPKSILDNSLAWVASAALSTDASEEALRGYEAIKAKTRLDKESQLAISIDHP